MRLKFISLISFFLIGFGHASEYQNRGMLIYLDDSETPSQKNSMITQALISSLERKAGPILASKKLLINYYTHPNLKEFREIFQFEKNEHEWMIKEINNNLLLLIPYTYVESLGLSPKQLADTASEKQATDFELKLGLKVNHLVTVNFKKIIKNKYLNYAEYAHYFYPELEKIFCVKADYQNHKHKPIQWHFYIDGHGEYRSRIVGVSLKEFREKILKFFKEKINTKLVALNSCYAASENFELIFKENSSQLSQDEYPFVILTQALTDTVVETERLGIKANQIEHVQFLDKFINLVTHQDFYEYKDIIDSVYGHPSTVVIGTSPQIKLPNTGWFSVLDYEKKVASIGNILAQSRDPEKSLDVVRFFKKDPKILLLYAKDIPFELIIKSFTFPAIVSMIPGPSIHHLRKISSQEPIADILFAFRRVDKLDADKIFWIDEIERKYDPDFTNIQNVFVFNKKMDADTYSQYALFTFENNFYVFRAGSPFPRRIWDESAQEEYKVLIDSIKGDINEINSITITNINEVSRKIPDLRGLSIIKQMNTPTTLRPILMELGDRKFPHLFFLWIETIHTGPENLIFKDLIVEPATSSIFFSENGKYFKYSPKKDKSEEIKENYTKKYEEKIIKYKKGGHVISTFEQKEKNTLPIEQIKKQLDEIVVKNSETYYAENDRIQILNRKLRNSITNLSTKQVQELINEGANPEYKINGQNLLALSVRKGAKPEILEVLIANGARIDGAGMDLEEFMYYRVPTEIIVYLIQKGLVIPHGYARTRLLLKAIKNEEPKLVQTFIDLGESVEGDPRDPDSVLNQAIYASQNRNKKNGEILKLIVQKISRITQKDIDYFQQWFADDIQKPIWYEDILNRMRAKLSK